MIFSYTSDDVTYPNGRTTRAGRTDLLEELLDHRDLGMQLSSPLIDTGAYMEVLEAVRRAHDPVRIPDASITTIDDRVAVDDIGDWVERTARAGALFSEVHAPFAQTNPAGNTENLAVDKNTVAVRDDGSAVTSASAPRPFLHPVRTLGRRRRLRRSRLAVPLSVRGRRAHPERLRRRRHARHHSTMDRVQRTLP